MSHPSVRIYLGRQPIVDRNQELVGFELLFRDGPLAPARSDNPPRATSAVATHAFGELGLDDALGAMDCFIKVDEAFLLGDAVELLPAGRTVLELVESVVPTAEFVARCEALRALGYRIALDDLANPATDPRAALLPLADICKLDLARIDEAALPALIPELRRHPAQLLAKKVSQPAQHAFCRSLGFDLFQGYFFSQPAVLGGRKLDSSKLVLMKLLSQIMEDVDTPVLESSFKQAPGLSVNLLRLVNSVASGLRVKISSLRHAITVLGRRQLQRWLQLLLYTDPSGTTRLTNPLLQLAATRGRLMELLARDVAHGDAAFADHAFVCGVMSLTPALLDMPLAQILAQVSLAAPINDALQGGKGRLGQLLGVVVAMEDEDPSTLSEKLLELPMLHAEQLTAALAESLRWANHIGEEAAA